MKENRNVLVCHYCQRKVIIQDEWQNENDENDNNENQMETDEFKQCCGVKVSIQKSESEDIDMMGDCEVYDSTGTPVSESDQRAANEMASWLGLEVQG